MLLRALVVWGLAMAGCAHGAATGGQIVPVSTEWSYAIQVVGAEVQGQEDPEVRVQLMATRYRLCRAADTSHVGRAQPCQENPASGLELTTPDGKAAKTEADGTAVLVLSPDASAELRVDKTAILLDPDGSLAGERSGAIEAALRTARLRRAEVQEAERRRSEAETRARIAQEETAAGRCTDDHHSLLDAAVRHADSVFDGMGTRGGDAFLVIGHDLSVATHEGTVFSFEAPVPGVYDVHAIGVVPVRVAVQGPDGYDKREISEYLPFVRGLVEHPTDSRVFSAKAGERYAVTVSGEGCAAVLVYKRL